MVDTPTDNVVTIQGSETVTQGVNFQYLLGLLQKAKEDGNAAAESDLDAVLRAKYQGSYQHVIGNVTEGMAQAPTPPRVGRGKDVLTKDSYNEEDSTTKRERFMDGVSDIFFNKTNMLIGLIAVLVAFNAFLFTAVSTNNASTLAAVQATTQSGVDKVNAIASSINTSLTKMDDKMDALNTRIATLDSNIDQKLELHDTQNELKTMKMMQDKRTRQ